MWYITLLQKTFCVKQLLLPAELETLLDYWFAVCDHKVSLHYFYSSRILL